MIPQELYNQIISNVPIACVDVAIVSQGAILLVQRNDPPAKDEWWLPGGRVLKGETMRETASRKAREEVGIECHVGPIIYTAETLFPDGPHDISIHSINSCFLLYPISSSKPKLDKHHSEYRWMKSVEVGLHPYVKKCLQSAGL